MPPRLRMTLAVATLCAVAIVIVVVALAPASQPLDAAGGFAGALRPASIPSEDFILRDQDGARARLADYTGRVVILTFLYSTCQNTCPIIAQQIRGALDQLGRPVPAIAVSVDPRQDTPANVRAFLVREGMLGRLRYLVGSSATLQPIWRAYGIQPQGPGTGPSVDHSAYVILIDKAGRQRIGFPDDQLTPEGLAHDVRRLEAEPPPARAPRRVML